MGSLPSYRSLVYPSPAAGSLDRGKGGKGRERNFTGDQLDALTAIEPLEDRKKGGEEKKKGGLGESQHIATISCYVPAILGAYV